MEMEGGGGGMGGWGGGGGGGVGGEIQGRYRVQAEEQRLACPCPLGGVVRLG